MDTDERLSRIEARLEKAEKSIEWAEAKLAEVIESPGLQKVLRMLGVTLR